MLETFLIISILSSFTYLLTMHNRLIVVRPYLLPIWCRTIPKILVSVAVALLFELQSDLKYTAWFHNLSGLKNYIYLGFSTVGIVVVLITRQASIFAQINPHEYDKSIKIGSLHIVDMRVPIILNILMYFWILTIPAFPFLNILILGRK